MNNRPFIALVTSVLFASCVCPSITCGQSTAFTYQGQLNSEGSAAEGIFDVRLSVHDAATGGQIIAGPATNEAVAVAGGLFRITLDFGSNVFTGPARWLEIGVRTNGETAFTILSPRQPIAPTPYAIRAAEAGMAFSAVVASTVAENAVGGGALQCGSVTAEKIALGTIETNLWSTNALEWLAEGLSRRATTNDMRVLRLDNPNNLVAGSNAVFRGPLVSSSEAGNITMSGGRLAMPSFSMGETLGKGELRWMGGSNGTSLIQHVDNWGGNKRPTLWITAADIRIEPNFSAPQYGRAVTIGNEYSFGTGIVINYTGLAPWSPDGVFYRGTPLILNAYARTSEHSGQKAYPGIQSVSVTTNRSYIDFEGGIRAPGELWFYSLVPAPNANGYLRTNDYVTAIMRTNSWHFTTRVTQRLAEQWDPTINWFETARHLTIPPLSNHLDINFTSVPTDDACDSKTLEIYSGEQNVTLSWPDLLTWLSEHGNATAPVSLSSNELLIVNVERRQDRLFGTRAIRGSKAYRYDPDATGFFARAAITDRGLKAKVNSFVLAMKTAGLWDRRDVIYPFVGGTAKSHAQNLKSSTFTITNSSKADSYWHGEVIHNANGITGGSAGAGKTTYTVALGTGGKDDFSVSVYVSTESPMLAGEFLGSVSATASRIGLFRNSTSVGVSGFMSDLQTQQVQTLIPADFRHFFQISRLDRDQASYVDGTFMHSVSFDSLGVSTAPIALLARFRENGGVFDRHSDANLRYVSFGPGLTSGEVAVEADLVEALQSSLGRANPR